MPPKSNLSIVILYSFVDINNKYIITYIILFYITKVLKRNYNKVTNVFELYHYTFINTILKIIKLFVNAVV